jgi:DNA-binding winged helix-turn-helix (wHTH) protein
VRVTPIADRIARNGTTGGRVASPEEISDAVWGKRAAANTVAVHIKRVRELGDDPQHGNMIRTVRGVGYRLGPLPLQLAGEHPKRS